MNHNGGRSWRDRCANGGSAWELRVYLGADPVTGKQRYATKTVRAGKREVVGYIERKLRPALGDVRLSKLTTASLARYYRSLPVDGAATAARWRPAPTSRRRGRPRFGTSSLWTWT